MKSKILTAACASLLMPLASQVLANPLPATAATMGDHAGFIVGLEVGHGDTNARASDIINDSTGAVNKAGTVDNTGFASRVYGGYHFNRNFDLELGYAHLPEIKYKEISSGGSSDSANSPPYAIDLTAKGMLNLYDGLDVYGKAGLAWLHMDVARTTVTTTSFHSKATRTAYVGLAGAGLSYRFNEQIHVNAGYSRYIQHGDIHSVDLFTLGLGYQF